MQEHTILLIAFISSVFSLIILLRKKFSKYLQDKTFEVESIFQDSERRKLETIDIFEKIKEQKMHLIRNKEKLLEKRKEEISLDLEEDINKFKIKLEEKFKVLSRDIDVKKESTIKSYKQELIKEIFDKFEDQNNFNFTNEDRISNEDSAMIPFIDRRVDKISTNKKNRKINA